MKILFSNPPWWELSERGLRMGIRAGSRWPFTRWATHRPDEFRFGGYLPFPFFLGHAASYTARELSDATVIMRDSIARGESSESFFAYIQQERFDFIVIETATPSWSHDELTLRAIRDICPESKIILGGPLDEKKLPQILNAHPNVVAIAQGEYDKQISKAVRQFQATGARSILSHDLLTREELAASPAPMFDEVCAQHYWDACPVGQLAPQLQFWTSRGCPFKCIFCVWPATMTGHDPDGTRPRSVRSYSPEYLEKFLADRLAIAKANGTPYRSLYLDDDTFNLTDRHVLAVCPVLKMTGLPWSAMCRADTIKPDTWRAMKDAGCFGVKLGFESGSQEVIDKIINKRLDLKKAIETARWLRSELKMTVHGTFTIGLPGETDAQRQETLDFIEMGYVTRALDTHQLSGTSEIEGTPLHTLRTSGHLDKYEGAKMDDTYTINDDGQKKIESLTSR